MKRKSTPRRRKKKGHFVLGQDMQDDGHVRLTRGESFLVHGGTEKSHGETVDIVQTFSEKLHKEGQPKLETARQILHDILKRKGYTPLPPEERKSR